VAVDAVELRVLRLPLLRPFATSQSVTHEREVLLARVVDDGVEGWGECGTDQRRARRVAVEMATLDAWSKQQGVSLSHRLGGTRTAIESTATVGFEDDADEYLAAGYRSLKFKVAPDHRPPSLPEGVDVQFDANGSFAGCAERVDELDDLGLLAIEQPLAPSDLAGHAELRRRLRTPICLDESIGSIDALDAALALGTTDLACVKASRLGGIAAAKEAHDRCVAAGVDAKVGGMLETGIGRAAALALASLPGFTRPADLSASDRYWRTDVTSPLVLDADGRLPVPAGPGLGVGILLDVIERYTVSVELVRSD
jgi:O-succinylbenzoate synthase